MQGWIKIHRELKEWQWYQDSSMVHLLIHLIVSANHKDAKWQGKKVKRGCLITSLNKLSAQTGISVRSLRTCLDRLVECGEIDKQSGTKNTVIRLIKYEKFQILENSDTQNRTLDDKQTTNKRQTNDTVTTTNKNENNEYNEKNDKNISARKQSFLDQLKDVKKETDSSKMLNDFFLYWTEHGVNDKKMRFEKEKSFGMARRLSRWRINQSKFEPKQSRSEYINQELNKHFGNNEPEPEQTHDIDYTEVNIDDFKGL
jgi:hypothetical protein